MRRSPRNGAGGGVRAARAAVHDAAGSTARRPAVADFASFTSDRAAAFSKCGTCRNKAARILARETIDAVAANPTAHGRTSLASLFAYVAERTGLDVTFYAFRAHLAKHEPERWRAWLTVRYGRGE